MLAVTVVNAANTVIMLLSACLWHRMVVCSAHGFAGSVASPGGGHCLLGMQHDKGTHDGGGPVDASAVVRVLLAVACISRSHWALLCSQ